MLSHGCRFIAVPVFRTRACDNIPNSKVETAWVLSALLLSSQAFWTAIGSTPLFKSKWHGWMLVYLTKRCINRVSKRQNKLDVFKSVQMNTISRFLNEKLLVDSLYEALEDCPTIAYINFIDNIIDQDNIDVHEDKSLNDILNEYFGNNDDALLGKTILILDSYYANANTTEDSFDERLTFAHDIQFEIRVICSTTVFNNNGNQINADVFARHGNQHKSWWFQNRKDFLRRQLDENDCIASYLLPHQSYTLMFCRIDNPDVESLCDEYLGYLGGQSKCKCGDHKLSLVRSFEKFCKCSICNERYEYFRCPSIKCKCCICKNCFNLIENNNEDHTVFIGGADSNTANEEEIRHNRELNEQNNNGNMDQFYDSDDDSNLQVPHPHTTDNTANEEEIRHNRELNEQNNNGNMDQFYDSDDDNNLQVPHPHTTDDNGYLVVEEEQDIDNEDYDEIDLVHEHIGRNNDNGLILCPDDFDDFVTSCNDDYDTPVNRHHDNNDNDLDIISKQLWDSTNTGEFVYEVEGDEDKKKGIMNDITINGHVILNQCGSLLTRKRHMIKGNKKQNYFIQKLCAISTGASIPLMYPEAMLFPSIFWKAAKDSLSIAGAIPSPLLSECASMFGFASIPEHVHSRLSNPSMNTSTDFHYTSFCYDKLSNLAANHEDTRIIIRRGLTVDENSGELGLRGSGDSSMLESFDSKAMVRNLCASQQYHSMTHFLTFTCNMKKHFGTKIIKEWIDSNEWQKNIPHFFDLNLTDQEEYINGINQASSGLLFRVWQEVSKLFLGYIKNSPSSPFKKVKSIFSRQEYQKLVGNLHHIHLIMEVAFNEMSEEEQKFVNDLCRCSIFDVVRYNEIDDLINDGTLNDKDDYFSMVKDANNFLGHNCNSRCLVKTTNGKFRCRKLNYLEVSKDNTKHTYKEFNNDIAKECLEKLVNIGMVQKFQANEHGYTKKWKSKLPFLHPQRHIPPTNPNHDNNMSPVEGYTFANCRSMQNIQLLTQSGGVNKYVCKYIGKIDEQNYVVVQANNSKGNSAASLMTKSTFLHNTKIASSKIQEDEDRGKDNKYPQGRYISHIEMLHQIMKYPEVTTDLSFITITTMPLEYRAGIELDNYVLSPVSDSAQSGSVSNDIRSSKEGLPQWRKHTTSEIKIFEDLFKSRISIDKITLFSLRPPELRYVINSTKHYFRWFHTELKKNKVISGDEMNSRINIDLYNSWWINGLQQQVLIRKRAFPELIAFITALIEDEDRMMIRGVEEMVSLFQRMNQLLLNGHNLNEDNIDERDDALFYDFMMKNLIQDDSKVSAHLPIPVFSYIKPTTGFQFIHHILLSMGCFDTEIDLTLQPSLREAFRYAMLIGPSNDHNDLERYSNQLLYRWIEEQLQYYAASLRLLSEWIVVAAELFDSIIIRNELSISDMPPVQLSSLFGNSEEEMKIYIQSLKNTFIDAIYKELGITTLDSCNVPTKSNLLNATKSSPLDWNAVENFVWNDQIQSLESFEEQHAAIKLCGQQIDKYVDMSDQSTFTKSIGIRGFPGSGKTWCSLYISLYALSKGLVVLPTALLAKRAIQLGGIHWHKLFHIPTERNLGNHRRAELAIISILRNAKTLQLLLTLDILICDEIGTLEEYCQGY